MNKKTKSFSELSNERDTLSLKLTISRIFGTTMTIAFCLLGLAFMRDHNKLVTDSSLLRMDYESLKTDYDIMSEHYDGFNNTINELVNISNTLDEQNQSLAQSNQQYYEELQQYKNRAELYDKYDYALIDEAGNRTDITYDQLQSLQTLVQNSSINDEDLILSWIMTESGGKENAQNSSSTAKGYGQFLNGTSKFVYTDLMGESGWHPGVALDGSTNMEMMVNYVDYLYKQNNGDLYATIRSYRGKNDISGYVAKIDSYLANKGKSVAQIAKSN